MATDGVKIIDGDHAHDVYHTFMDLYDAGASLPEIAAAVEPLNVGDDVDTEIFVTAYALALWEIGELNEAVRAGVAEVIERGAFATYLTEQEGLPAEGRRRYKVLERFWQKINQPNPRIRKRRNYKPAKTFIFNDGDVLAFQLPDGSYRATIMAQLESRRNRHMYQFITTTYHGIKRPTMEDIMTSKAVGRWLRSSTDAMWGLDFILAGPKPLRAYAQEFERIGTITIEPDLMRYSSYCYATDFQEFTNHYQYLATSNDHQRVGLAITDTMKH
ncbi:hypothetical protein KLP40_10030 [Hymenobacter sp. NST-14]|uniref:hypothetical protein n=1 Tax=Hymenobacter piscis TaxID=2839984 RepID=UPI001C00EE96|nr:hypothetical protein [Hymenobacter piscis]MBT9393499.1 hypothetical protein [Hymenobacter piscis]